MRRKGKSERSRGDISSRALRLGPSLREKREEEQVDGQGRAPPSRRSGPCRL